jgi:integrase
LERATRFELATTSLGSGSHHPREKITNRFIAKYCRDPTFPPAKKIVIYDTELKGFCLVVRPSGSISFVLRYRRKDGASCEYTIGLVGSLKANQARKIGSTKYGEVKTGIDIQAAKRVAKVQAVRERQQTLKVFFEEKYRPYCQSQMRNGIGQLQSIDACFVRRWPDTPLTDINPFRIQNWRKEQIKRGLTAGGVNRPVSALKAMLNRAVEWGVIESNPLNSVKPLKEDNKRDTRYLSEGEEKSLRDALDAREGLRRTDRENHNNWCRERSEETFPNLDSTFTDHLKPIVLLALNTGMRRGELFNLMIADVDLKDGRVVVQGLSSKSGNSRFIPLTNEAKQILKDWIDQSAPEGLLFPSPVTGKRFNNINKSWQALIQSTDIENFRFHDLRHTFASKLAMRSVDLYVIKELMGHASIETTQRYAHLSPDYKTSAIENLNR